MVKKKSSKKKVSYNNKKIVLGVIVLVILFVFAFTYQGSREDEGLGQIFWWGDDGEDMDDDDDMDDDEGEDDEMLEKCCVCQYMERNQCNYFNIPGIDLSNPKQEDIDEHGGFFPYGQPTYVDLIDDDITITDEIPETLEEACNSVLVDRTVDCKWVDGVCMSRFKKDCLDWAEKPEQENCDPIHIITDDESTSELSLQCEFPIYMRSGHGPRCIADAESIIGCINYNLKQELYAYEDSCSTFQNIEEFEEAVRLIQNSLPPGTVVIWTAHQSTLIKDVCTSTQTVTITSTSYTSTYGLCSELGASTSESVNNLCARVGERATCTEDDGTLREKMCCPRNTILISSDEGIHSIDGQWVDIDSETDWCAGYEMIEDLSGDCKRTQKCIKKAKRSCLRRGWIFVVVDADEWYVYYQCFKINTIR